MKAAFVGIQYAVPETILDNEELATAFPTWPAAKILAKTGIRERRIAGQHECASDLAVQAARALLAEHPDHAPNVDYLLHCTQSPDYILPATACVIQNQLQLPTSCGALDINQGCSGYVYGLGIAKALIETKQASTVLLTTADTYSRYIHPGDKSARALFGDAASATLLQADTRNALPGPFVYGTDGSGVAHLLVPTGGARSPRIHQAELVEDDSGNARTVNDLYLNGPEVFHLALRVVPEAVASLLEQSDFQMSDIDLFVFHQANRFMLDHLRRKLHIPTEKFLIAMEDVGNTVSSSIPIALRQAMKTNRLSSGNLVMLVGFGAGFSWAATLIRWTENDGFEESGVPGKIEEH